MTTARVTTADAGTAGNLNVHSDATTAAPIIGEFDHLSEVTINSGPVAGAGSTAGWYNATQGSVTGWASGDFLTIDGGSLDSPATPGASPSGTIFGLPTMAVAIGGGVALLAVLWYATKKKKRA